ncbi:large-conductance mechanosensitive channel protein MscL [Flavobacteriaceae bacterium]|nr:large-conductance mechanosensitive channel protein MscL [Flavobacteriaceae bacterium]MDA9772902.1 large-conductance mechanosensitive channel protein MscL [Flavobacteriaceae bacterium]MDB4064159.1 large-conductance mechanosensitive channel protein MscL [Flavobacteriaceae bacterium]|tara:strand:+ start:112 stop:510 length:399 start_codon:yes stop_codon:yes gene_type:complete
MLKEFKEFALKGNLVDIAIGFVMGAAFKQVVTSFTAGIVSPLIGLVFKADFKDLKWIAREADTSNNISEVAVLYGDFITNVIDFVIVAFVMFIIIKGINATKKKEAPAAPALPSGPTQEELLEEIRDLLAKK